MIMSTQLNSSTRRARGAATILSQTYWHVQGSTGEGLGGFASDDIRCNFPDNAEGRYAAQQCARALRLAGVRHVCCTLRIGPVPRSDASQPLI